MSQDRHRDTVTNTNIDADTNTVTNKDTAADRCCGMMWWGQLFSSV